jgi:hypothetical protein
MHSSILFVFPSDLPGVNPATLNGMLLYYCLMTKWSGLGYSTELSRVGLSQYAWVFFLEEKGDTFGFVQDLVLRLSNERHKDAIQAICSDNGSEFRNSRFETFFHDLGFDTSFRVRTRLPRMVLWKGKTEPCVRWLGQCLMSIGLREGSGLRW